VPDPSFRSRLFWLYSRVAHALYCRFPIFGAIRGAVAVIRRDGGFVVIERNDGYGLGFPGGIAHFHEPPENTVRREVHEETGLTITHADHKFRFRAEEPFPNITDVFEATADGEFHSSWEGTVRVATLSELQQHLVTQQRPILEYLLSSR